MTLSEWNKNSQSTEEISIIAYFFCTGLSTNFSYFNTMVWLENIDLPAIILYKAKILYMLETLKKKKKKKLGMISGA